MKFIIIYITHANERAAKKIAAFLIENKYVACANIFPITSAYWWKGYIENQKEYVSIVKTKTSNWEAVKKVVEEIHPYDTPCIMKIDTEANEKYVNWILESVEDF